jgi:hypothetical protein
MSLAFNNMKIFFIISFVIFSILPVWVYAEMNDYVYFHVTYKANIDTFEIDRGVQFSGESSEVIISKAGYYRLVIKESSSGKIITQNSFDAEKTPVSESLIRDNAGRIYGEYIESPLIELAVPLLIIDNFNTEKYRIEISDSSGKVYFSQPVSEIKIDIHNVVNTPLSKKIERPQKVEMVMVNEGEQKEFDSSGVNWQMISIFVGILIILTIAAWFISRKKNPPPFVPPSFPPTNNNN